MREERETNNIEMILFRLEAAIANERLALAEQRRKLEEAGANAEIAQRAKAYSALHNHALRLLALVATGDETLDHLNTLLDRFAVCRVALDAAKGRMEADDMPYVTCTLDLVNAALAGDLSQFDMDEARGDLLQWWHECQGGPHA